jgi:hypothetical protein
MAVIGLVACHVGREEDFTLLCQCLMSVAHQTRKLDVFCLSWSTEAAYQDRVRETLPAGDPSSTTFGETKLITEYQSTRKQQFEHYRAKRHFDIRTWYSMSPEQYNMFVDDCCFEPTCLKSCELQRSGKLLSCGGCHVAKYCEKACQLKHRPHHKQACKIAKRLADAHSAEIVQLFQGGK